MMFCKWTLTLLPLSVVIVAVSAQLAPPLLVDTAVISELPAANGQRACPSSAALESAKTNLSNAIQQQLTSYLNTPCGGVGWTPVVMLNLTDSSQQCPSVWVEASSPSRSCYANINNDCRGVSFPINGLSSYSQVCGRAIGYAVRSLDAFANFNSVDINGPYLDGISVTHGSPRQHIWSFAGGHPGRCPCQNNDRNAAPLPPSFVGENYFCDGEYNSALWDGIDCTVAACCTPPWFNATLPAPTSDNIEVRLCADQHVGDEAPHVRLIELYVK